jgi:hypothetical protein
MGWLLFIGVAVFMFWRQRSEGVVTVNPLRRSRQESVPGDDAAPPQLSETKLAWAQISEAMQIAVDAAQSQAGKPGGDKVRGWQGRDEIKRLVRQNKFLEAIEVYKMMYGVDLKTAKRAVDKMALSGD